MADGSGGRSTMLCAFNAETLNSEDRIAERLDHGPSARTTASASINKYISVGSIIGPRRNKEEQIDFSLQRFLMEILSESSAKSICSHCERDIPTSNIDLHYAHCSRNLLKCTICNEMVPKKHADEHYNETHAPVECPLCSETVEREEWSLHKGERCTQRMITCEYCEFPLPAVDLYKHQEICGNRTELCHICNKYIRLRERDNHEIQFHVNSNDIAESSRRDGVRSARDDAGHRRQAHGSPQKKVLLTIAVSGIAVLIGSFFLQRGVNYS